MKPIYRLFISFKKRFLSLRKLLLHSSASRGCPDAYDYSKWIRRFDTLGEKNLLLIKDEIGNIPSPPIISIILTVENPVIEFLEEAIKSIQDQIYPHWQLCITCNGSAATEVTMLIDKHVHADQRVTCYLHEDSSRFYSITNAAIQLVTNEYLTFIDQHDQLHPLALYWSAREIITYTDSALIYSDEDKIDRYGLRKDPYFKCDYNYELLLCQNMIRHLGVYSTALVKNIGGFREGFEGVEDYDLALRVVEQLRAEQIRHIPRVLYHVRINDTGKSSKASLLAVKHHFERMGISATAEEAPEIPECNRIHYAIPVSQPSVDIIIPTRDKANLLRSCIDSLLSKTTYNNYSITLVDNGSTEQDALSLFNTWEMDHRFRILRDRETPFNYSRLNNRAVRSSRADFVCLMNNDIEIISHDWLHEMIGHALQPGAGAVGARLWYPNGTLQHGGVIVGYGGVAGHAHRGLRKGSSGYFGRACLQQEFSAVTAACLVVSRVHYLSVDGLDEHNLAVMFNDVDFCLKLNAKGLRNVWTPYAEMFHHESVSKGRDGTVEKKERAKKEVHYMRQKWSNFILHDSAYNLNLALDTDEFSLAWPPRRD